MSTATATATEALWTTEHIATFLGLTRRHVTERLVTRPDFPKPEINYSSHNRKWQPEQVRQWARKGHA